MGLTPDEYADTYGIEDMIKFENPDYTKAFIGVTSDNQAVYDYNLMVKCLVDEDDMTEDEAAEFIDYNTIRALPYAGPNHPIVMYSNNE